MRIRSSITSFFSAAVLAIALTTPAPAIATPDRDITFALNTWIGYAPLYVASKLHYFGKYHIKYIHMDSGINAALMSDDVDIADLSMNQVIVDDTKGKDIKVFFPIDYSYGADAIVAKDDITSVDELKGQVIPLNTASYSELLLAYALSKSGLPLSDVKMVDTPASAVPAVLLGGHASAGVTWAPHVNEIIKHGGYHTLYSSRQAPGLISDSMCASSRWIMKHPNAAKSLISGMLKGETYIQKHPQKAFAIVGSYMGISPAAARAQYAGVINPDLGQMHVMMSQQQSAKFITYFQSIQVVEKLMKDTGKLSPHISIDPQKLLYPEYVSALYTSKG